MATRRSTLDLVLLRAVTIQPGITLSRGVKVSGLLTAPAGRESAPGAPPHVTGVRTDSGDRPADVVVDASGRRSAIDDWLTAVGAAKTSFRQAECGIAYYSRHYRLRPGVTPPGSPLRRMVAALDEFLVGLWPGDNATMQLALLEHPACGTAGFLLAAWEHMKLPRRQGPGHLHPGGEHRARLPGLA